MSNSNNNGYKHIMQHISQHAEICKQTNGRVCIEVWWMNRVLTTGGRPLYQYEQSGKEKLPLTSINWTLKKYHDIGHSGLGLG